MRIALLDNNFDQIELMRQLMASAGHACHVHESRARALESAQAGEFDLLIADESAVADGVEFLHTLRTPAITDFPILLLVSHAHDANIAPLLDAGASDYVLKPLRRRELAIRVRVLLRRAYPDSETETAATIHFGQYTFNTAIASVTVNGTRVHVTRKEFELALLFFRHLGRPLSRALIREAVWPDEPDLLSRTMDTHVSRVRNKLCLRPENGFRLAPVYSFGYRLEQLHL